jgi:hypothetical protein
VKQPPQSKPCPDLAGLSGHGGESADPCDGLSAKRARAVEALLQEPTMARAAAAAGVGERSLRRWLREPAFRDALLRARRESFGQAIGLTQKYAPVAVAALVRILNDSTSPHSSRVSAAGMLLKFGREGLELDDLAERVDRLEQATPPRAGGMDEVER